MADFYHMSRVSEHAEKAISWLLVATLLSILALTMGCGSSNKTNSPTTIYVTPRGQSVVEGASLTISAAVNGANGFDGLAWKLSGPGQLSQPEQNSILYTAPPSVAGNTDVVVTATTNSGSSGYAALTVLPFSVTPNVQPVLVNGGPTNKIYPNGGFTSVTVCTPGTTKCNTIQGILVDTGSVGLRILSSALPPLPNVTDAKGTPISECFQFVDQSYVWGQVAVGDVKIAGEVAGQISIHSIADPTGFSVPSDCSNSGSGTDISSQQALGANGILGIGLEPQDCGFACDPSSSGKPPGSAYYACSGSCSPTFVPLQQQVDNPTTFFATDNNGLILQFPALAGVSTTLTGSIIFGIGTQTGGTALGSPAANGLGSAVVFTVDANDNFTTQLSNTGQQLTSSFINSGSSGFFFPDGIPTCSSSAFSFFCPDSLMQLTATNVGTNGAQSTIVFSVDNADNLFAQNPAAAAFSTLAGQNSKGTCASGSGACSFEWGMPFFYGRSVYVAINGQLVPPGAPPAPWWAYAPGSPAPVIPAGAAIYQPFRLTQTLTDTSANPQ